MSSNTARRTGAGAALDSGPRPLMDSSCAKTIHDQALAWQEGNGGKTAQQFCGTPWGGPSSPFLRRWGLTGKWDWGLVSSFAAREVFVSTMSTVYKVETMTNPAMNDLEKTLQEQKHRRDPRLHRAHGVSLMVFYVFGSSASAQSPCGARNPIHEVALFQWAYMGFLGGACLRHFHVGGRWDGA